MVFSRSKTTPKSIVDAERSGRPSRYITDPHVDQEQERRHIEDAKLLCVPFVPVQRASKDALDGHPLTCKMLPRTCPP